MLLVARRLSLLEELAADLEQRFYVQALAPEADLATRQGVEHYNVIALTYLVLTLSLAVIVKILEWFLNRGRKRAV